MNGSLPRRVDVVVIGGGIVGVSVAYYLAKKGIARVLLLEKEMLGSGSTGKSVGGIRTQFSTRINIQFSLLSRTVFEDFETEFGTDPMFQEIGYLFLAGSDAQWDILKSNGKLLRSMAQEVELLTPSEIHQRWPFLRVDDLEGGSYTAQDGYAGPSEVLQGFVKGARRLGAVFREGIEVTGIEVKQGSIRAVTTSTGEQVQTPVVVNAAGPYAARVAALAGVDIPVRPLRRQVFYTDAFDDLPAVFPMIIDMEYGWYTRREGPGVLLAGPQDSESSYNQNVDFEAREWTARRSLHRLPVLERARIAGGWAGLYEISPDNHAIIGAFPELPGFICANGFSGHGFMHAPATGIVVSELIVAGKTETLDIYPLRPQRFREEDLIKEPLTAFRD
ncbi:MAG: FAD-binding oxidoreductase [Deltaproteobacteria bacterium]|nr:FAD-binding oxidoreductase [Deltaproteobacteria bacterium]MBW2072357.1 FAD-binding oxidoreductase [Deltaproteobacteria bacterium]